MKIYTDIEQFQSIKNPVLTIGTFDGVHVGHQKIIEKMKEIARKTNGETVIFTFFPHPRMVVNPANHGIQLIQSQEEKFEKLAKLGVDHVIVFPFTKAFSEITAAEFVSDILISKLNIHTIIVGYDHQFGKNREGNLTYLENKGKEFGFEVIEIPAHEINAVNVSSSKIRHALSEGDIETANHYLNGSFEIWGKVIHGNKLGRSIGFPTANIGVDDSLKIVPGKGVYAVTVSIDGGKALFGMMNIGVRPTVNQELKETIEVNIFDFKEDIYEKSVRVCLHKRIRNEHKFDGIASLTTQLKQDEKTVRSYFHL
ncbi:MAG: bifunctional riboflavin kinase/FAD synthetase [Crocinitomicaceae bacterium]